MQYVAKVELFERRWQGWLLSRLGAFPIRRGQSDETAMETARLVARARRDGLHLPRGDADPVGLAGHAEARRRPPRAGDRRRRASPSPCMAASRSAAAGGSGPAR